MGADDDERTHESPAGRRAVCDVQVCDRGEHIRRDGLLLFGRLPVSCSAWVLDWIFNTAPVFVIIGIIAGFVSGFAKLWSTSRILEEQARARGRIE